MGNKIIIPDVEPGLKLFLKPESSLKTDPNLELATILEAVTDDGFIIIQAPIHKNTFYPLSAGEIIFLNFSDAVKNGRLDFEASVESQYEAGALHYVKAKVLTDIAFTQRRDYFRVKAALKGEVNVEKREGDKVRNLKWECSCLDLSGGGALIGFSDNNFTDDSQILLSIPVCGAQCEKILSEIRWRNNHGKGIYKLLMGVQFCFADKPQQKRLMQYVFECQQQIIRSRRLK